MDKKEILDILDNAKDERGAVPMRLVRQAFDKLVQPERTEKRTETHACDLISRGQAIDAINTWPKFGVDGNGHIVSWNEGLVPYVRLEDVMQAIENLPPAQPEPQWIPVSERLPEESEYYIITANDGVGHRTTFAKFQKKAKSWDLTGARSYWKVIAWMPLPTPYTK